MGFLTSLLGGGSKPNMTQALGVSGMPIQSSVYGRPIAIVHGTTRVSGNLMELDNFGSQFVSGGGGGGGGKGGLSGGGGGKGGGGGGDTLTYHADLRLGLAEGPITAVVSMWSSQTHTTVSGDGFGWSIFPGTYPQSIPSPGLGYGYCGVAYAVQWTYPLGGSPNLPQFNWEVEAWSANVAIGYPGGSSASGYGQLITYMEASGASPFEAIQTLVAEGVLSVTGEAPPDPPGSGAILTPEFGFPGGPASPAILVGATVVAGGISYNPATTVITELFQGSPEAGIVATPTIDGAGTITAVGVTTTFERYYFTDEQAQVTFSVADSDAPGPTDLKPDADPSLVVLDLLCNPYYGASFPPGHVGGLALQTENQTVPMVGPFVVTAFFASSYAFNVNVADAAGIPMLCVAGTPTLIGQYAFDGDTGIYTFSPAQGGQQVQLRYASRTGLAAFQAFTMAQGLMISPAYDSQSAASAMIGDICTACYISPVWSSGYLNFIPRGTETVTGNGYTWSPTVILFALTDDDFVQPSGTTGAKTQGNSNDPLLVSRTRPSDQINDLKLEYLDRTQQYAPAIAEYADQASIDAFGKRTPSSLTFHFICDVTVANLSVQLQIRDQHILNTYSFSLDERYLVLDLMDIVSVTDSKQEIFGQWVRITSMVLNDDGTLSVVSEEYPTNAGVTALYSFQNGTGFLPNFNQDPGSINDPVLFGAPPLIAGNQALELFCALSGANSGIWGGCEVWVSSDGDTYRYLGKQQTPTRMGFTLTALAAGSDPDTTHSLQVNLGESNGELVAGTDNDADQDNTAALIRSTSGDEYIAFSDVTLTGPNKYLLDNYIRRGQYNTNILSHPSGASFVRVDDSLFSISYQPAQIGQTVFLKFPSFNVWNAAKEDLSVVTAYEVVLPEPPAPPDVTGFTVSQNGVAVVFTWSSIPYPLVALAGYYIGYAPSGTTDWGAFKMLTEAQGGSGTEMTNADVPPGLWRFGIRAANIANQPGTTIGLSTHITYVEFTVVNNLGVVSEVPEAPLWAGPMAGLGYDYHGLLVPLGTVAAAGYAPLAVPPVPALSAVASGLALTFTAYVVLTYVTATGETLASVEASQAITTGHAVHVASPPAVSGAAGYNVYAGTSSGTETQQNGTPVAIGTGWTQTLAIFAGAGLPTHNSTGYDPFDYYVPDPVAQGYYITSLIDAGLVEELRIASTMTAVLAPLQSGSIAGDVSFALDHWSSGSDPNVFSPIAPVVTLTARYLRDMLIYVPVPGRLGYLTEFEAGVSNDTSTIMLFDQVVAPGGSTIAYGRTFPSIPFVTPVVASPGALYASVTALTDSDCVVNIYDNTGSSVGGLVNLKIEG